MDHFSSSRLMDEIAATSRNKAALSIAGMLLKGFLSGALFAYATAFALTVSEGLPAGGATLVSAAVFPAGSAIIVLLGLELATGNFAVLPFGLARGSHRRGAVVRNWSWVYLANFLGSVFVGGLLTFALTKGFTESAGALGARIVAVAEAKTLAYQHAGASGWFTALVSGVLCNWMVALGTVLGLGSTSSIGKVTAVWLPISMFFGLGLEHSVVNMFVVPTAIALGADIGVGQWLWWNQLPVTVGNLIGGVVLTGLLLHFGHPAAAPAAEPVVLAEETS